MGKRRHERTEVSSSKTEKLDIPDLLVLDTGDSQHYYAVHVRYFSDDKLPCPACGSRKTRCSKVIQRKFKDIIWSKDGAEDQNQEFLIIDLTFYQRYLRCDGCGEIVFPEPVGFAQKGCRYTNRLSDALAEGTFRFSYKKVCDYYGVPASTASVGPIMRRRIQYKESLLPSFSTPKILGIMEIDFFQNVYPAIFAVRDDIVYWMDILADSSEETVLTFLRTLNGNEVSSIYIDPIDSIRSAAAAAFPGANIYVTDECLLRYEREAMLHIIHEDGKRFPVKFKDTALTVADKYLHSDYERNQINNGLEIRPRLKSAYEKHQSFLGLLSEEWTYEDLRQWIQELPENLSEFAILVDIVALFDQEIMAFITSEERPPKDFQTSLTAVCDAFNEMPHCIFDVLRARCFLTIPFDTIEENGEKYRLGIQTDRLVENMNDISLNIKEAREYGL